MGEEEGSGRGEGHCPWGREAGGGMLQGWCKGCRRTRERRRREEEKGFRCVEPIGALQSPPIDLRASFLCAPVANPSFRHLLNPIQPNQSITTPAFSAAHTVLPPPCNPLPPPSLFLTPSQPHSHSPCPESSSSSPPPPPTSPACSPACLPAAPSAPLTLSHCQPGGRHSWLSARRLTLWCAATGRG